MTNSNIYAIINIILYNIDIYNKYILYINKYNINNKELKYLVSLIPELYSSYPEKLGFSVDDLETFFKTKNLGLTEKQYASYQEIFSELRQTQVAPEIAQNLLEAFKKQQVLSTLSQKAWEAQEGSIPVSDLSALLSELENPIEQELESENLFVSTKLTELYTAQITKRGLRWRVKFLNDSLGSLRKGDFGFLFARPETGKTTFLASEVTHMALQLTAEDGPILWFNNEEQGEKVYLRCIQATLGKTMKELGENLEGFEVEYERLVGSKLKILDSAVISRGEVERLCKKYSPSLIVFDQIDKIHGFTNDREDLRLGAIYIWARELAKLYCPVIGVCQADGTAEGQRWLTMDNVANAKTSKQAEADWILGIGKTHDPALNDIRYFNISKNKLAGDDDSDPSLRHGRAEVLINAPIAHYEDILA